MKLQVDLMTLTFDLTTLKMVCRENSAEVTTTARAAAAAALLYGGASSPGMMMDTESPTDCVTAAAAAAFRHQLLAATAVVAARSPGYIAPTPSAPAGVHRLPTSPTSSTSPLSNVDHHAAAADSTDNYDYARVKQQLTAGKHRSALCHKNFRGTRLRDPKIWVGGWVGTVHLAPMEPNIWITVTVTGS